MEELSQTKQIANIPDLFYTIANVHWCKRRPHDTPPTVQSIQLFDYNQQHNLFCTMIVTYTTGQVVELIGRVLLNSITGSWSVNGVNSKGDNVTIRLNSHII